MTDLDLLLFHLRAAFAGETIRGPLRLLGEGFYSTAVRSVDGMVFRIGRAPGVAAKYARETVVLPRLRGQLPVEVPCPRFFLPAGGAAFPYGLIAYPMLPGEDLNLDALSAAERDAAAAQVGALIAAIQRIPPGLLGLQDDFAARRALWARQRDLLLPALREALPPEEWAALRDWWAELLADESMGRYTPVFQHGDLWYGNLLADGPRITAALDWSEMGAGDPALDFAPQFYPGEGFFSRVMQAFESSGGAPGAGFARRLSRLRLLRELGGVEYSILQNDPVELADSIHKLRRELASAPGA